MSASPQATPRGRIKTGKASLVGGVAVGLAAFALWVAISHELGVQGVGATVLGLVVAGAIGAWIRIADL
jgi:hypothetical protein